MTTRVSLIADSSVTGAAINNSTITADDIADNTITTSEINFGTSLVPLGAILMWSGVAAPSGYQLCDGTALPSNSPLRSGFANTPDLRERFVVGAGSGYAVAATGGSKDAVVVSHGHVSTTDSQGAHRHGYVYATGNAIDGNGTSDHSNQGGINELEQSGSPDGRGLRKFFANTAENGSHSHNVNVTPEGVSGTNQNLPPYYALAFIMRVL